jgi:hypothetical protein
MGIDHNILKCILWASKQGVSFEKVLTVGHQGIYMPSAMLSETLKLFGIHKSLEEGYADPLFELLGAKIVDSIDFSDFEKATIIHDMNLPLNSQLHNSYSIVLDSGSLEHIFNFPCAMKNCMEAVRTGGHFIMITTANNFMGHGFYQYSPEILYRVLSRENGFEVVKMLFFESKLRADFFEITDPAILKTRVTLVNNIPTYIFVLAKRVENVKIFSKFPQQSDWVSAWEKNEKGGPEEKTDSIKPGFLNRLAKKIFPSAMVRCIRNYRTKQDYLAGMNKDMSLEPNGIKRFNLFQ